MFILFIQVPNVLSGPRELLIEFRYLWCRALHGILSHVIYVHFNYLCFHIHVTSFVLALEREESRATPSFLLLIFSSKRVTAPSDFPHPHLDPSFLPLF